MAESSDSISESQVGSLPPISCYVNFGQENSCLRIKCATCSLEKTSIDELEAHIAWDHMKWMPYQCGSCPAVSRPTDFTIRIHMQEVHPSEQQKTVYTPDEAKLRQLKNSIQKSLAGNLFENIQNHTVAAPELTAQSETPSFNATENHINSSVSGLNDGNLNSSPFAFPANFPGSAFPDLQFPPDATSLFYGSALSKVTNYKPESSSAGPTRQRKRQARHISQMTHGGDATSDTQCSLCDAAMSMEGLTHVNHVFQHVESSGLGARFTCAAEGCSFAHFKKGLLEQHCRKDHNADFSLLQDNTSSLLAEFDVMKSRCFPNAPKASLESVTSSSPNPTGVPSNHPTGSRGMLTCAKCAKTVRRELVLRHVYEYHLSGKPLRCPYCPYATGYLLFNLRHHVSNCHSDKPMTLIDEREKYQPEVFRLRAECFPTVYQKIPPNNGQAERQSSASRSSGDGSGIEEAEQHEIRNFDGMKRENGI